MNRNMLRSISRRAGRLAALLLSVSLVCSNAGMAYAAVKNGDEDELSEDTAEQALDDEILIDGSDATGEESDAYEEDDSDGEGENVFPEGEKLEPEESELDSEVLTQSEEGTEGEAEEDPKSDLGNDALESEKGEWKREGFESEGTEDVEDAEGAETVEKDLESQANAGDAGDVSVGETGSESGEDAREESGSESEEGNEAESAFGSGENAEEGSASGSEEENEAESGFESGEDAEGDLDSELKEQSEEGLLGASGEQLEEGLSEDADEQPEEGLIEDSEEQSEEGQAGDSEVQSEEGQTGDSEKQSEEGQTEDSEEQPEEVQSEDSEEQPEEGQTEDSEELSEEGQAGDSEEQPEEGQAEDLEEQSEEGQSEDSEELSEEGQSGELEGQSEERQAEDSEEQSEEAQSEDSEEPEEESAEGSEEETQAVPEETEEDGLKDGEGTPEAILAGEEENGLRDLLPEEELFSSITWNAGNIVIYGIDGTNYSVGDFSEDEVALFYGRTSCSQTGSFIAAAEKAKRNGRSIKIILMDVDSTDDKLNAYALQHPDVLVSHNSSEYVRQFYQFSGKQSGQSVTFPVIEVYDHSGNETYNMPEYSSSALIAFKSYLKGGEDSAILTEVNFNGTVYTESAETILARINEIRKEACQEGVISPSTGAALKSTDYVAIRWSSALEKIALQRAAEACVVEDHTRPNGSLPTSLKIDSITTQEEVLAWNYTGLMDAIEQWYGEKSAYVNKTGGVTGHYTSLIDPTNKYIGLSAFELENTSRIATAGEFYKGSGLNESKVVQAGSRTVQIETFQDTVSLSVEGSSSFYAGRTSQYTARILVEGLNFYATEISRRAAVVTDATWSSSDSSVLSINQSGLATGQKAGSAVISAEYDGMSAEINVTVKASSSGGSSGSGSSGGSGGSGTSGGSGSSGGSGTSGGSSGSGTSGGSGGSGTSGGSGSSDTEEDEGIDISKCAITLSAYSYVYDGTEKKPAVTVKYGSKLLKAGDDYEVEYDENIDAGQAFVWIYGDGYNWGYQKVAFTIVPRDISGASLSIIKNHWVVFEDGTEAPDLDVKLDNHLLEPYDDYYTVPTYDINAGIIYAQVIGRGNYTGSCDGSFPMTRNPQKFYVDLYSGKNYYDGNKLPVGSKLTAVADWNEGAVSYKSSNNKIAAVSNTGVITAKKVGTVKITVTAAPTMRYEKGEKIITLNVTPAKTASLKLAITAKGVKLSWKKVAGAIGYCIYRNGYKVATVKKAGTVSYTDTKANINGWKYQYEVYAYSGGGMGAPSAKKTIYYLEKPTISSAKNVSGKKIQVKWKKNEKATGYEIRYVTGKKAKIKTIKKKGTVSAKLTGLSKGKTYKVSIRSYKKVGKTYYYSAWSAAKSVKVKK